MQLLPRVLQKGEAIMNNFAAKVQRIVYLVVLLFCILIPYSRAGISVTSPDFKRNSAQDNEYPLDITLGDIYLIPEKEYAVSNNEHDVYRLVAEVCIHNKSKKPIVIAWEHTIRGDGASGITITPEGAIKSLEPKHYPLGGNCSNHQKKLKKNKKMHMIHRSGGYQISQLNIPHIVRIKGKLEIAGNVREYTIQRTIVPKDIVRLPNNNKE